MCIVCSYASRKSTNSHQNRGQTEVQNGSLCHNSYQQLVPMNKASSFSLTAFIKGFNMKMDVNQVWFILFKCIVKPPFPPKYKFLEIIICLHAMQIKANLFSFFDSCGEITDIILHEG